jgi:hypothetical protein
MLSLIQFKLGRKGKRFLPGFEGEIIHLGFLNLDSAHGQGDLCNHLSEKV